MNLLKQLPVAVQDIINEGFLFEEVILVGVALGRNREVIAKFYKSEDYKDCIKKLRKEVEKEGLDEEYYKYFVFNRDLEIFFMLT